MLDLGVGFEMAGFCMFGGVLGFEKIKASGSIGFGA